jgi:hypothetical protein
MAAQRYQMPENTSFGEYLEEINVTDFDPHGFVADSDVGDPIVTAVLHRKGYVAAADWMPHEREGTAGLRYWANADDAAKGGAALGEVIRLPVPESTES